MKIKYVEISVATLILIISIYGFIQTTQTHHLFFMGARSDESKAFALNGLEFNFYRNYFVPVIIGFLAYYTSFLWIACGLSNRLIKQNTWGKALLFSFAGFIFMWALLGLKTYLLKPYHANIGWKVYNKAGQAGIWFFVLALYQTGKQLVSWLFSSKRYVDPLNRKQNALKIALYFVIFWFTMLSGCAILHIHWGFRLLVGFIIPCAFLTYMALFYWLIPVYWDKRNVKQKFWLLLIVVSLAINTPLNGINSYVAANGAFGFVMYFILVWLVQLAFITPLSFYLYYEQKRVEEEITGLKTNLGTSAASLLFLRSQINPHFLFNALNTLYGMALIEKAEKTGNGIQKLGDMMRFMLHENQQDSISLAREIDYLRNYIELQNMRISNSNLITLSDDISDIPGNYNIAPMLLIPFVENAYKYGISSSKPSWIRIGLKETNKVLNFEVTNSIHKAVASEKASGIGLQNVKQRLQLLYANRHKLLIQHNEGEYIVNLTIQLS